MVSGFFFQFKEFDNHIKILLGFVNHFLCFKYFDDFFYQKLTLGIELALDGCVPKILFYGP